MLEESVQKVAKAMKNTLRKAPPWAASALIHAGTLAMILQYMPIGTSVRGSAHATSRPGVISGLSGNGIFEEFYKGQGEAAVDDALEALEDQLPMDEDSLYDFLTPETKPEKETAPPSLPQIEGNLYVKPRAQQKDYIAATLQKKEAPIQKQVQKEKRHSTAQKPEFAFPTTLPELKKAQEEFYATLLADMNDDPEGQVDLNSMSFLEFFTNNWYYNYAIEQLENDEPIYVTPNDIKRSFAKINSIAERYVRPDHTVIQKAKLMHAAIMSQMRGYELNSWEFGKAAHYGVLNCNSGTQLGVAEYDALGIDVQVNVTWDHVQPALQVDDDNKLIFEFTTPKDPVRKNSPGKLFKPEAYVVGALLDHSNAWITDFPDEVQDWYDFPFPNLIVMRETSTGLPFVGEESGIKKPKPGFKPFTTGSDFSDKVEIKKEVERDLTARDSGLDWRVAWKESSSPVTHNQLEALRKKHTTWDEELAKHVLTTLQTLSYFDYKKIEETVSKNVKSNLIKMGWVVRASNGPSDFLKQKPWEDVYSGDGFEEAGYRPERTVLPKELLHAHPEKDLVGLFEDLEVPTPEEGQIYMGFFRVPAVDWCEIGEGILDNRILLYGPTLPDQVKGIHMRQQALNRVLSFTLMGCDLRGDAAERVTVVEQLLAGEKVPTGIINETFRWFGSYVGFDADPLLDFYYMVHSQGTEGVSLFALEDLLSFSGEQNTVDRVIEYLQRPDVELEREGYGRLMVSLNNRLITHRDYFATQLEEFLGGDAPQEAKVAAAQVLHSVGKKSKRVPDTLEEYLLEQEELTVEDVLMFAKTGLGMGRARRVMRREFKKAFDSLSHGQAAELQEKWTEENRKHHTKTGDLPPMPEEIWKTQARIDETFAILAALGDRYGFEKYKEAFDAKFKRTGKDKYKLLNEHNLAEDLIRHHAFIDDIIQTYLDSKNQKKYLTGAKKTRPVPAPHRLVGWLHKAGHGDKAIGMLRTILDNDQFAYGYDHRITAAMTLFTLGEHDEAREAILGILEEGCYPFGIQAKQHYQKSRPGTGTSPFENVSWEESVARVVVSPQNNDGQDHVLNDFGNDEVRPALVPLHLLAQMGLKQVHYDKLHQLARDGKMCFPTMHDPTPSRVTAVLTDEARGKLGRGEVMSALRPLYNMLVKEAGRKEVLKQTAEYQKDLVALGLLPDALFEHHNDHLDSAQNVYFDSSHPQVQNQMKRLIGPLGMAWRNPSATINHCNEVHAYLISQEKLTPFDVAVLRDCSRTFLATGIEHPLFDDYTNLLIAKGHVLVDDVGTVTFYDSPQFTREQGPPVQKE